MAHRGALGSRGNAYVADEWINRISIFTQNGDWVGQWSTSGSQPGELNRPAGLAFDTHDNLYVVDSRDTPLPLKWHGFSGRIQSDLYGVRITTCNEGRRIL